MNKLLNKLKLLSLFSIAILYIAGAMFTNTYMQKYRWDEWQSNTDVTIANQTRGRLAIGTAFWPAYWGYVGSDKLLDWMERENISLDNIFSSKPDTVIDIPDVSLDPIGSADTCPKCTCPMCPCCTGQTAIPDAPIVYEVPRVLR